MSRFDGAISRRDQPGGVGRGEGPALVMVHGSLDRQPRGRAAQRRDESAAHSGTHPLNVLVDDEQLALVLQLPLAGDDPEPWSTSMKRSASASLATAFAISSPCDGLIVTAFRSQ
jgi:hypothetical protein